MNGYAAIVVAVAAPILPLLGISVDNAALTTTVTTLISIAAGIVALVKHYRANQASQTTVAPPTPAS